jgi:hypothetical protein
LYYKYLARNRFVLTCEYLSTKIGDFSFKCKKNLNCDFCDLNDYYEKDREGRPYGRERLKELKTLRGTKKNKENKEGQKRR